MQFQMNNYSFCFLFFMTTHAASSNDPMFGSSALLSQTSAAASCTCTSHSNSNSSSHESISGSTPLADGTCNLLSSGLLASVRHHGSAEPLLSTGSRTGSGDSNSSGGGTSGGQDSNEFETGRLHRERQERLAVDIGRADATEAKPIRSAELKSSTTVTPKCNHSSIGHDNGSHHHSKHSNHATRNGNMSSTSGRCKGDNGASGTTSGASSTSRCILMQQHQLHKSISTPSIPTAQEESSGSHHGVGALFARLGGKLISANSSNSSISQINSNKCSNFAAIKDRIKAE
jgi:hypothetical protein